MFLFKKTLCIGETLVDLSTPKVMGILNVSPDSFFDGGRYIHTKDILDQSERMLAEGVDFIDVGGCSTRPGAKKISLEEELKRTLPAIHCILKKFPKAKLSIDTFQAEVAQQALDLGAVMVNDISGGQWDEKMFAVIARYHVPYILTHMRGTPQTMTFHVSYCNLWNEMNTYFQEKIKILYNLGVKDIILDPGFGFAKTTEQNFTLLKNLKHLHLFEKPIIVGISRKSLIWKTLKQTPQEALNGSTVLHTVALLQGAHILRVHDVKEAVEAVKLINFVS